MRIGGNLCFLTLIIAIINTLPFFPYFQYSQRNKNHLKIRESQQGKCIKIKRPAHLSIVERLSGYWCCKGTKKAMALYRYNLKMSKLFVLFCSIQRTK